MPGVRGICCAVTAAICTTQWLEVAVGKTQLNRGMRSNTAHDAAAREGCSEDLFSLPIPEFIDDVDLQGTRLCRRFDDVYAKLVCVFVSILRRRGCRTMGKNYD